MKNLLSELPADLSEEITETLVNDGTVRIERIVSSGHASDKEFWYDQDQCEWVTVLQGKARLEFEGDDEAIVLGPGDYLNIPAHTRHRVGWTSPDEPTVWLAIFYG